MEARIAGNAEHVLMKTYNSTGKHGKPPGHDERILALIRKVEREEPKAPPATGEFRGACSVCGKRVTAYRRQGETARVVCGHKVDGVKCKGSKMICVEDQR